MENEFTFLNKMPLIVGMVALGAASSHAQYVPGTNDLDHSKTWSLSADFRGFYDDNDATLPRSYFANGAVLHPLTTWGTEITPSAGLNHSAEKTLVNASYIFDARLNENRGPTDLTHQFNGCFEHEFGEGYKLSLHESFVSGQEPTIMDPDIVASPLRISGDNKRNTSDVGFKAALNKQFDLHLGYGNTLHAYQQLDGSVIGYPFVGAQSVYQPVPSYSDLLDRMEQSATLDLEWKATAATTGILGYQFENTSYTSRGYILYPYGAASPYLAPVSAPPGSVSSGYRSNVRDSDSHIGFVGAEENFTSELHGSLRIGSEYMDYYKFHTSRLSPYVDAALTYDYLPGDSVQLGVKHIHNATDIVGAPILGAPGGIPVLDQETTAVSLSERHNFSKKFTVSLTGQLQDSDYVGGGTGYKGKGEDFFVAQLSLAYHFTPWLLAETGYNYSRLTSDLPFREYTRNFVFLGVRGTWGQ